MRRMALLTAAAFCLALATAGTAQAYVFWGAPWPQRTIAYYTPGGSGSTELNRAARTWNRLRLGVRFRRADRKDADVTVDFRRPRCGGEATVGFAGRSAVSISARCGPDLMTLTAVHELGHVLGLGHERRRCATMNANFDISGTRSRCPWHPMKYWLRHPLRPDDIRGARALYRMQARAAVGPLIVDSGPTR